VKALAIIVTYNSDRFIAGCVQSLRESDPALPIVVVDNASSDGTVTIVREMFPQVVVIETGANLGYAGANNVGLRYAQAEGYEAALIANPDCTFDRDCVPTLIAALGEDQDLVAVSPVILRADRRTIWYAGAGLDVRLGKSDHVIQVPSPSPGSNIVLTGRANGCAMLVRLSLLGSVGYLDERYFLYYEEAEWCARCSEAGLKVAVVPTATAYHDVGHGTAGKSQWYYYYMTRNRLLLVKQHNGRVRWALPLCLYSSLRDLSFAMKGSLRQGIVQLGPIAKGYVDFVLGRSGEQATTFSWWPVRAGVRRT
jgi:GT2 family glycosyltransferase